MWVKRGSGAVGGGVWVNMLGLVLGFVGDASQMVLVLVILLMLVLVLKRYMHGQHGGVAGG